ncbi:MAG: O-antigen ligase family protein [Raineya sp.]|nr:O-antigen ligase family protein [Raineya sp.]
MNIIQFLYTLALVAFSITLPIDKLIGVNSVALLLLSATWLVDISWKTKWQNVKKDPFVWIWIAFFFLMLIGLLYTDKPNIAWGWNILQRILPLMAIPLILLSTQRFDDVWIHRFLLLFTIALFGAIVFALGKAFYLYTQEQNITIFYNERLAGFIRMSGIYLASFVGTAMLILSEYIYPRKSQYKNWQKVSFVLLFAFFGVIMLLLNIRMAIGALLIVYAILLIWKIGWKGLMIASVGFVIVGVVITNNTILKTKFKEAINVKEKIILRDTIDHSLDSLGRGWGGRALRVAIWDCSTDILKESWLIGVGTGDTQTELTKTYRKNNFLFAAEYNTGYNAHNQFLETWLTVGIVGLILLLLNFAYLLKKAIIHKNYLLLGFTIFIVLNCLTETYLQRQKGISLYAFMTSMLLMLERKKEENEN